MQNMILELDILHAMNAVRDDLIYTGILSRAETLKALTRLGLLLTALNDRNGDECPPLVWIENGIDKNAEP